MLVSYIILADSINSSLINVGVANMYVIKNIYIVKSCLFKAIRREYRVDAFDINGVSSLGLPLCLCVCHGEEPLSYVCRRCYSVNKKHRFTSYLICV